MSVETGSSAVSSVESGTGDDAIALEPFIDPFAPVAVSGAIIEERTLSGGILEIGSAHANLEMTVFLNIESPYAREFAVSRLPMLITEFIEPGDLRIRLFILPIEKYKGSANSARAIACAADQGKGYPMLDRLFREAHTTPTQEDATALSIEAFLFENCMQTNAADPLAMSHAEAERYNITLVPSYVIEGILLVGLPTEADVRGAIRAAL